MRTTKTLILQKLFHKDFQRYFRYLRCQVCYYCIMCKNVIKLLLLLLKEKQFNREYACTHAQSGKFQLKYNTGQFNCEAILSYTCFREVNWIVELVHDVRLLLGILSFQVIPSSYTNAQADQNQSQNNDGRLCFVRQVMFACVIPKKNGIKLIILKPIVWKKNIQRA